MSSENAFAEGGLDIGYDFALSLVIDFSTSVVLFPLPLCH